MIYTSVTQRFNKIFFRGYNDSGKRIQSNNCAYSPKFYVEAGTDDFPDAKSLYSKPLQEKEFKNISEARNFVKTYKDVMEIHGNDRYEYNFIHRNFEGEQKVTIADLTVILLDIETTVEFGFPDVKNPLEEVLLITCQDYNTRKLTTFGCQPYTGSDTNYILCRDESDLLQKWINYCIEVDFDIMTGWNVIAFDMAYLGSRIIKVLGQKALNRLSPFGFVDAKTDTIMDREILRYEITGRTVLDMLELYKKFRFINRPNYKLQTIATVELGDTKLENPYKTFKEHYQNDWNSFTSYNIKDVTLLSRLEDKLGLVYLAVTLAYLTKVNYSDVYSPVKTWESYILSTLYEENVFCPLKEVHSSDHQIVGGYVKEPVPGLYDWVVSYDFESLYPCIIMSNNMSPETIVDQVDMPSIDSLLKDEFMKDIDQNYTICANGARFRKDILGVMPRLTDHVFASRKKAKRTMLDLKSEYELVKTELKSRGIEL